MMIIKEYQPSKALSKYVRRYATLEDGGYLNNFPVSFTPTGTSEMYFHSGCQIREEGMLVGNKLRGYLLGPHNKPITVTPIGNINSFSVEFQPWGAYRIFGIPASDTLNYAVELDELCGSEGRRINEAVLSATSNDTRVKLIDDFLLRQYNKTKDSPIKIHEALAEIDKSHGIMRIKDLSRKINISIKTLERNFKAMAGIKPKEYASICRLYHVYKLLKMNPEIDLHDLVVKCSYYDQSHFSYEIKRFTNMTANEFISSVKKSAKNRILFIDRIYTFNRVAEKPSQCSEVA